MFTTFIYDPLYNALIFLLTIVPYADVGIAVIALTIVVKVALFPLAHKAVKMQAQVRLVTPEVEKIKEEYKENKQEQTLKIMALYKERNIRPFTSLFVILIQIPIIFGLYFVFFKGGLPDIDTDILYSFITAPPSVNMMFLGLIDMGGKSVILALLAGGTQYIHTKMAFAKPTPKKEGTPPTLKDDLARSFQLQMRYVMPIIVTVIAYSISAAIALYWLTSNLFAIGQELLVQKYKDE